jgi:hypothetical protein
MLRRQQLQTLASGVPGLAAALEEGRGGFDPGGSRRHVTQFHILETRSFRSSQSTSSVD